MTKRKCTKEQTTIYKIVSVLASKDINREFAPRSGQTEDNTIGICCFSSKHAELRRGKDRLYRNQNNAAEWGDLSTRRVSVASVSENYKNITKSAGLVQGGYIHHFIEYNLFLAW